MKQRARSVFLYLLRGLVMAVSIPLILIFLLVVTVGWAGPVDHWAFKMCIGFWVLTYLTYCCVKANE